MNFLPLVYIEQIELVWRILHILIRVRSNDTSAFRQHSFSREAMQSNAAIRGTGDQRGKRTMIESITKWG